jgi:hypothetical protein
MLKKVISGGQTGADIAGVATAKKFGYEVGGLMPKGFKTLAGPRPNYATLYNMQEHTSAAYPPRTYANVKNSDGTLRFAYDFGSSGELCTMKAILQYKKWWLDVNLIGPIPPQKVVDWLIEKNIETLNVAGNSEKTYSGMTVFVSDYLTEVFTLLLKRG